MPPDGDGRGSVDSLAVRGPMALIPEEEPGGGGGETAASASAAPKESRLTLGSVAGLLLHSGLLVVLPVLAVAAPPPCVVAVWLFSRPSSAVTRTEGATLALFNADSFCRRRFKLSAVTGWHGAAFSIRSTLGGAVGSSEFLGKGRAKATVDGGVLGKKSLLRRGVHGVT
jgi:hypothetical protein